jgi:hypothetical protein
MIRRWRRFFHCFLMWKTSGLGVIAAVKATRRYHRKFLG